MPGIPPEERRRGPPPTVWYRKQDRFYYTTVRGTKHKLSRVKREADRLFHALLAADPDAAPARPPTAVAPPDRVTVAEVLDAYLEHVQLTKSHKTYVHRRGFLNALPRETKLKPAADLRERDVTAWLLARPTWGHNSRVTAKNVLKACLGWATRKEKLLAVNPAGRPGGRARPAAGADGLPGRAGAAQGGDRRRPVPQFPDLPRADRLPAVQRGGPGDGRPRRLGRRHQSPSRGTRTSGTARPGWCT